MDDRDIAVELEQPLPRSLPVGTPTAVFCYGHCYHRHQAVRKLELAVDGRPCPVTASRMPRLDLMQRLHRSLTPGQLDSADLDPGSAEDPELRCYRSGFWATVPLPARERPGTIELSVRLGLADGTHATADLASIDVVEPEPAPSYELPPHTAPDLIAVCMATFDPDIDLFRTQIESLRAQTHDNWICLISDDCSRPERFEQITETLGDDPRFAISRSDRRLGFYKNFERALRMVPAEAELIALCDQDDRWYPDKLAALRDALGTAELVYSDQRLVDPRGRVLRKTFWDGRRNNHTSFASLLIANTIVGAASLFRRRVLDIALPFPKGVGWEFHDHWLGIVAMATGEISYVDRPLYDYVQHPGAVLGKVGSREESEQRPWWRPARGFFSQWRSAYFLGYVPLEVQARTVLLRGGPRLSARRRRVLRRFLAAARSPIAFVWLATRPVREIAGRNETLGTEAELAKGILWRHLLALRTWRRERPKGRNYDARLPSPYFEQKRLRRWQARRLDAGAEIEPAGRPSEAGS